MVLVVSYSTFGFSAVAGVSPSLKAWGGWDRTDSDCEWSESSLIPTLALSFPAESFSNPLNPVKNLCPFSTLGLFLGGVALTVIELVRQTIGSAAKDAQKRNRASESDVTLQADRKPVSLLPIRDNCCWYAGGTMLRFRLNIPTRRASQSIFFFFLSFLQIVLALFDSIEN